MSGRTGTPMTVAGGMRTNQVLIGALIMGVVMFGAVVAMLRLGVIGSMGPGSPSGAGLGSGMDANLLLGIMAALLVGTTVAGVLVGRTVVNALRRRADQGETFEAAALMPQFSTLAIMKGALAEGPALFGVVITLITGNWLGMAGAAAGLVLLALQFPTRGKFEGFVRDATGRMP